LEREGNARKVRARLAGWAALFTLLSGGLVTRPLAVSAIDPTLAGQNLIQSVGPAAVRVRLPAELRIEDVPFHHWASLTTTGTWAALELVDPGVPVPPEVNPSGGPVTAFELMLAHPDGCSTDVPGVAPARCIDPDPASNPRAQTRWEQESDFPARWLPNPVNPTYHNIAVYPPGDYVAYLLTDPGAVATASFAVPGLGGQTSLAAATPVRAEFRQDRASGPASAVLDGQLSVSPLAAGAIWFGTWSVNGPVHDLGAAPLQEDTECLYKGLVPQGPVAAQTACGYANVGPRPVIGGEESAVPAGYSAMTTAALAASPDRWTLAYRAEYVAAGAAMGVFVLSVEYLDGLPQAALTSGTPRAAAATRPASAVPVELAASGGWAGPARRRGRWPAAL
jgi:hypothetical protein